MKHSVTITLVLIALFVVTQFTGLGLLSTSISTKTVENETVANYQDTLLGPRPEASASEAVVILLVGVLIGTLILLGLIKLKQFRVWKAWFFIAVGVAVSVSLSAIFHQQWLAWVVGFVLAAWKIFKPNVFIHNLTEILTYSAIALIFVPLLHGQIIWVIVLLGIISIYDMIAVWKSKHMVSMAKFQTESKVFAGLFVPYGKEKGYPKVTGQVPVSDKKASASLSKGRHAILGGGDLAFPLLFVGAAFERFLLLGLTSMAAFWLSAIVILGATIALTLLFFLAEKDRFYPAMPFLTAGCLVGYLVAIII
ncbi:MAG: presenilin family intramembrane aspartyl protease [Candidatus Woesearchaeota archaeon]